MGTMKEEERVALGRRIQAKREELNWSKAAAARAADVDPATYNKAELGLFTDKGNSPVTLRKIIRTLAPETDGDVEKFLHGFLTTPAAEQDTLDDDALVAEIARRLRARRPHPNGNGVKGH